jgi:hypothetical protein
MAAVGTVIQRVGDQQPSKAGLAFFRAAEITIVMSKYRHCQPGCPFAM